MIFFWEATGTIYFWPTPATLDLMTILVALARTRSSQCRSVAVSQSAGSSFIVSIGTVTGVETFVNNSATQTVNFSATGRLSLDSITTVSTAGGGIGSINGSNGDDFISGFDLANGGQGFSDVINAGVGNDTVLGNAGDDIITDFMDGIDQIEIINQDSLVSFNVIDLGATGTAPEINTDNIILLQGFDIANLDSTDFV